jgi:hypothetical protein
MKNSKYNKNTLYVLNNDDIISELEMTKKFKSNNVVNERLELYKDFTINLLIYIYDTYLGNEYIKTEEDIKGHFNWCYKKVLSDFFDEEISFYENDELYKYFWNYYIDQFYTKPQIESQSYYERFWENIFEIKKNKNRSVLEVLLELYEIFDKSIQIKNKQNIDLISA